MPVINFNVKVFNNDNINLEGVQLLDSVDIKC